MTALDPHSTCPSATGSATRRDFLRGSSATLLGAGLLPGSASALSPAPAWRAGGRGDEKIRVALVGCGGRGTGAASQALSTAGPVELVAMADAFEDRLAGSLAQLSERHSERVAVPPERRFVGFGAYEKAIDSDVDLVILATPPGFRPIHFERAIAAGRHVFMEKPVAVDAPGIRQVLAAAAESKRKNLKVGVGLQRHHDPRYQETVKRIQDGAIGELVLLRCYWNSAGVWVKQREPGMTEMQYQMRNWYYFNWLCGDHIVEQHIHNLDVCNWIKGAYPVEAHGQGGREVRTGAEFGEIFDHHMVEFTYADGTKMISQCRHVPGAWSSVSEHAHGTRGSSNVGAGRISSAGGWDWRYEGERIDPYQREHDDLFAAIRQDLDYNEAENGARSTMTSILGRLATYSGQVVKWDAALASNLSLAPAAYTWDTLPRVLPNEDGRYPVPVPGKTKVL